MSFIKNNAFKTESDRRRFLRNIMLGSVGLGSMAFLKKLGPENLNEFFASQMDVNVFPSLNAMDIMKDALNFGSSLGFVSQAMAATNPDAPAVYRVFYQTSHDSRNELYLGNYGNQYNSMNQLNFAAKGGQLAGLNKESPIPILNEWAFQLLTTGKIYGTSNFADIEEKAALTEDEIDKISVIGSVGMTGTAGVHRNGNIPNVGTLEYAMLNAYKGYSPIGSVSLNAPIIDAAGGINSPARTIASFASSIDVPGIYMSRDQVDNPVRALDDLTGSKRVKVVRDQMLDAHKLLSEQIQKIQTYSTMGDKTFNEYGQRNLQGLASMMMFADLFEAGLATIGSVGMDTHDFHATDALRSPSGAKGNMLTETSQALAGAFHIAKAAFASKKDAIVHFTTCSNRSADWVKDDSHVSTITLIFKGSERSKMDGLSSSIALVPDTIRSMYAEGPGASKPTYTNSDAEDIKLTGEVTVGRLEATIVSAAGKCIESNPDIALEEPVGKLT